MKLLVFALCVDTKKQISNTSHYLRMSLRNMELLRTPTNRISRKLGSKKLPHAFLQTTFPSPGKYLVIFHWYFKKSLADSRTGEGKSKGSAFGTSVTRRSKGTRIKTCSAASIRRCWMCCCLSMYQINIPPFSAVLGELKINQWYAKSKAYEDKSSKLSRAVELLFHFSAAA